MAVVTRPGSHGTPMKPYGSFAGKSAESGNPMVIFMMQFSNQYNGGLMTGKKKAK